MIVLLKLFKESFLFAYGAVMVNKLRTLLTLLGITIGIFAIISIYTVVDSLEENIRSSISSLGDDIIYIQKWPWSFGEDYPWWEYMKRPLPKISEYREIKKRSQYAESMAFTASTRRMVRYNRRSSDNTIIWAVNYEFQDIRAFEIESGRFFSPYEVESSRPVAVIGKTVAEQLFKGENPLGKQITVGAAKFIITGVAKREGNNMFGGGSLDEIVLIPVTYARYMFDLRSENMNPFIMVKAKKGIPIEQLSGELREIMRSVHRLRPLEKDDFALNQASIITQGFNVIFGVINVVSTIIGIFSLLVGGFGIANIMFVSVRERTNIIGIQKALGAKRYFILLQFLYEATLLALFGGAIGLLLVYGGTWVVRLTTDFTITLTVGNIIRGLVISGIIGLVSGFLPAWHASRLNPVQAINTNV
jgi:putative ABC transport system permease protein